MIGSQDLCLGTGKADEVFDNVKQTGFVENTLNKSVELGKLGIFITAVFGFPLHETVFPGGDRSGFGGGKVAHHEKRVVNEERGNFVHIVPQLQKRFGGIRFFAGRRFQLKNDERQAVDKNQHIGSFFAVLNNGPLIGDDKGVALDVFIVDQFH